MELVDLGEPVPDYTPILDFIYPLSYLHATAKAIHEVDEDAWSQYLVWMRGCWQGEAEQILGELRLWQQRLGLPPADAADTDPRSVVATTITYLENNRRFMNYDQYLANGYPIGSGVVEGACRHLVKDRMEGTGMRWRVIGAQSMISESPHLS